MLLEREGEVINHKRVHRIYREAGLALRRKKRKHCARASAPLGLYTAANQEWALDFVHDVLASGRTVRVLNVIDAYTRESLAMEVDRSFAGLRVTRALDAIIAARGKPDVESFNSKLRGECLRVSWLQNLFEARRILVRWRQDYNTRGRTAACAIGRQQSSPRKQALR